jgi:hypothetical protein
MDRLSTNRLLTTGAGAAIMRLQFANRSGFSFFQEYTRMQRASFLCERASTEPLQATPSERILRVGHVRQAKSLWFFKGSDATV